MTLEEKMSIFCTDLNEEVANNKIQVIGRQKQILDLELCLEQLKKSNPLLIGEAGVGKTTLVEGLAERINKALVPPKLLGRHIITLKVSMLIGDNKNLGESLDYVINQCIKNDYLLFIDEIHKIVGAGAEGDKALDLSNLLKPALARGELNVIGATTIDEYHKYIEQDQALDRRFNKIIVEEPNQAETLEMLKGNKKAYEDHYSLIISDKALEKCVQLADRYVYTNRFPDKGFDVLDQVLSMAYEKRKKQVEVDDFLTFFAKRWHVPLAEVKTEGDLSRIVKLNSYLKKRIKGQPQAIERVYHTIMSTQLSIINPNRPLASFLFLGPTGVGKTEMAKSLANYFFGSDEQILRFDMSDYGTAESETKLLGDNNHDGRLINAVKARPYSIILFDEVEKGYPDIYNALLPLIDEGYLRDRYNRKISFKNTIIVMTSNLAADFLKKRFRYSKIGTSKIQDQQLYKDVEKELSGYFKEEFLNRIDCTVVFDVLSDQSMKDIIESKLKLVQKTLFEQRKIKVDYDWNEVINYIFILSDDKAKGARPIMRAITQKILGVLSEKIINNRGANFSSYKISVSGKPPSKTDTQGTLKLKVTAFK